ncbi:MAG: hypothetical protein QW818_01320 [Candidatus Aenigmatarchaeota archaeon]|nr:hypothetical protein [Candidatus Aenigmarchaeota archaeon]
MKINKELMLFSVVSIVFLAGCARAPETPAGAGVIITSFAPDVQSIDPGSTVTFTVNLKNVGGMKSSTGKAILFGLSNEWMLPNNGDVKGVPALAPADPSTGLSGEDVSIDFTATFPSSAAKKTDVSYDASVRVVYGYSTIADTLLRFVKADFLRTAPNTPKGIQSFSVTAGPLLVTASARTSTIPGTSTTGRVQFEIQNIGPGRVVKDIPPEKVIISEDLDVIKTITITGVGRNGNCAGISADESGTVTLTDQRLVGGKSKVISCDVAVGDFTNFKDVALNVKIDYAYFVDSTTRVTVLKVI